ncbi:MAG: DNA alkylation repair protein [endosymbiont of Galathealinum brachiosum]|uniref:DNA alkylation repair protein n=1 Tax=endosymbiont of Galathealinum brachiosum TaxID=2200906 RepID=A0A370DDL0_9GAMM|nr:MAG: DNA alkylation repair protein [endosymbiont of Galathealinum brachiosum]
MSMAKARKALKKLADPVKAKHALRFFKTGKGDYGEGDKFIGATMPMLRKLAKEFTRLDIHSLEILLHSKIHEERMLALLILMQQFNFAKKDNDKLQQEFIFNYYLSQTHYINNWDLVDVSCRDIVGGFLLDKNKKQKDILINLSKSDHLWEKRISIVCTWQFIREHKFDYTLRISKILIKDEHDLIHKAVGWMLREVGKKDIQTLMIFLQQHYRKMPRTMLRYAIEKLDKDVRQDILKGHL